MANWFRGWVNDNTRNQFGDELVGFGIVREAYLESDPRATRNKARVLVVILDTAEAADGAGLTLQLTKRGTDRSRTFDVPPAGGSTRNVARGWVTGPIELDGNIIEFSWAETRSDAVVLVWLAGDEYLDATGLRVAITQNTAGGEPRIVDVGGRTI